MNLKKFAVRGFIALAAVVALCMFFSGTIRTITTAKVKLLTPKQGKLIQTVELSGKAVFPGAVPKKLAGAEDVSLTVASVLVQPGSEVKAGDVLFTAEIADYEKSMAALRTSHSQQTDQLNELERKNRNLRLKRTDEEWAEAYYALTDARAAELEKRIAVDALLVVEGLKMEEAVLPEGASEALRQAHAEHLAAKDALAEAEARMQTADRYNIDDAVRAYIVDRKKISDQLASLEAQMVELSVLRSTLARVTADADGYVTEVNVKPGEAFNPRAAAYSFSPKEEMPVLRVDAEKTTLAIAKGMKVTFTGKKGQELESEVVSTGLTVAGEKFADVELTEKLVKDLGGSVALLSNDITVGVSYKARDNTTLLPSSAVRGEGEERYVYIVREKQSAFGTISLVTEKMEVRVLAEAGGVASVAEDLSWMKVAYMEDREIANDTTVMEYVN